MDQPYLIFGHRGARFGLEVRSVREMVWLPELSPIEELPAYIVGVFNLRGRVVPVMDLGLRFGRAHEPFLTSDRIIVIDSEEARVGIVASELYEVSTIPEAAIDAVDSYQGAGGHAQFVSAEARLDDGLVMLLDVAALLRNAPSEDTLSFPAPSGSSEAPLPWFGKLSAEEAELFRSRARNVAQVEGSGERVGLEAFAVIRLAGELFGLALKLVREFAHARNITPLPCCPAHIVGNMNLRGDILTLVDIRSALAVATDGALNEVMVVRVDELLFGLPATEIVDVVYLAPSDIAAVPVGSDPAAKAYCKGVASVAGQAIGMLDLERLLASLELRVAEPAP